jgi:phage replication O-like protein O
MTTDTPKTDGVPEPNYTQIPNVVFQLMPLMKEAELRVVLAICRQTFGWHRKRDRISLRQLQKLTGLSRPSVTRGVEQGIERGLIDRREVKKGDPEKGYTFALVVNESYHFDEQDNEEWESKVTTSGKRKLPQVVNVSYQQKKDVNKGKENGGGKALSNGAIQETTERPAAAALSDSHKGNGLQVDRPLKDKTVLTALQGINRAIEYEGLGDPLKDLPALARQLEDRGETFGTVQAVWQGFRETAGNPVGALVWWSKKGIGGTRGKKTAAAVAPKKRVRNGVTEEKVGGTWYPTHQQRAT